jgi:cobalt ECF transporter T component CbiQ
MYASISEIEVKKFIRRVWLVIPLILLIMSIPAMTNIFIPGKPIFYFYRGLHLNLLFFSLPPDFYLSAQGLLSVVKTVMRVGVSISFGYLLIVTTRWSDLVKGLSVLKVPVLVTAIFNMTYRYIYILSKISLESMEARFLRTVGDISNKKNRNFIANRMSFLFVRSHYISDEIYDSMKCRGYFGKPVSLKPLKVKAGDIIWIVNNVIIALMIIFIGEMIF